MSATVHTAIRVRPDDLQQLKREAGARGISMATLLVDSALKRLPEHTNELEQRVDHLEQTVQRLDRILELGNGSSY